MSTFFSSTSLQGQQNSRLVQAVSEARGACFTARVRCSWDQGVAGTCPPAMALANSCSGSGFGLQLLAVVALGPWWLLGSTAGVQGQEPDHSLRYVPHNTSFGTYYDSKLKNATIPSLSDYLAKNLPECTNITFDTPVDGKFYKDSKGYLSFELDACRLRRPSADEIRTCLAGKRIAFFGDSVVRYQYLSVVHFLAKGLYDHPYDGGVNGTTFEAQWGDWRAFYDGDVEKLKTPGMSNGTLWYIRSTTNPDINTEKWEFVITPPGMKPISLDMAFVTVSPTFTQAGIKALNMLVFNTTKPKPDIVIYNMAHWWAWTHPSQQVGLLSEVIGHFEQVFREAQRQGGRDAAKIKYIYRTHTVPDPAGDPRWTNRWWYNQWDYVEAMVLPLARFYKFNIYDAGRILKTAIKQQLHPYHDTVHPLHFVWEQFNDVLWSIICPAAPSTQPATGKSRRSD